VGAVAVHGFNGIWGTVAVGLFDGKDGLFASGSTHLFAIQTAGVLAASLWGFGMAFAVGIAIKKTIGIRVTPAQEEQGLDIVAHGIPAYNELERFSDAGSPAGIPSDLPEVGRKAAFRNNEIIMAESLLPDQ
jgi:Amt family ammonium transporter